MKFLNAYFWTTLAIILVGVVSPMALFSVEISKPIVLGLCGVLALLNIPLTIWLIKER